MVHGDSTDNDKKAHDDIRCTCCAEEADHQRDEYTALGALSAVDALCNYEETT